MAAGDFVGSRAAPCAQNVAANGGFNQLAVQLHRGRQRLDLADGIERSVGVEIAIADRIVARAVFKRHQQRAPKRIGAGTRQRKRVQLAAERDAVFLRYGRAADGQCKFAVAIFVSFLRECDRLVGSIAVEIDSRAVFNLNRAFGGGFGVYGQGKRDQKRAQQQGKQFLHSKSPFLPNHLTV